MKFCGTAAYSLKWISRLGIIIATPSKNSPGARLTQKLKLPGGHYSARSKHARNIPAMRRTDWIKLMTLGITSSQKGAWNLSATWDTGHPGKKSSFAYTYRPQCRATWEQSWF